MTSICSTFAFSPKITVCNHIALQSTIWADTVGSTTIHPSKKVSYTVTENKTKAIDQATLIATQTAKSPGGFMPSSGGEALRPATSLGFTDSKTQTRPPFNDIIGIKKPPSPEPASEAEFAELRREIYRKGVSLRRAFGRVGPGARLRTGRFREIVDGLQLAVAPGSVDRVVAHLDPARSGTIDLARFVDTLNMKVPPPSPACRGRVRVARLLPRSPSLDSRGALQLSPSRRRSDSESEPLRLCAGWDSESLCAFARHGRPAAQRARGRGGRKLASEENGPAGAAGRKCAGLEPEPRDRRSDSDADAWNLKADFGNVSEVELFGNARWTMVTWTEGREGEAGYSPCLPACLPARLPACLPACLLACLPAVVPISFSISLLPCPPSPPAPPF